MQDLVIIKVYNFVQREMEQRVRKKTKQTFMLTTNLRHTAEKKE